MLEDTLAIVIAGHRGDGLAPLTRDRAKAAVPFGGEYRLIDFCLTNCLHSGLRRVYVLTDYQSRSLEQHLRDGWSLFNPQLGEFIEAVPPRPGADTGQYPKPELGADTSALADSGAQAYASALEALADQRSLIESSGAAKALVVPGDQVYRMDYAALLDAHDRGGQDVTLAYAELPVKQRCRHPNVTLAEDGSVAAMRFARADDDGSRESSMPHCGSNRRCVSMGVVVFSTELLIGLLDRYSQGAYPTGDLERELLPALLDEARVAGYRFGGKEGRVSQDRFWSDVSTADDYFAANMALLEPIPPLDLYQDSWSIWSVPGKNPPARTVASRSGNEGIFVNSIVSNGTVITGGAVSFSVLSPSVRIEDSATVERSILFEGVTVGEGASLRNCIIDKFVHIEAGDRIGFDAEEDAVRFTVSPGGIVLVSKGHGDI